MTATRQSYSELRRDALKEIGNIGAGNAVTALSEMLGRPVRMSTPSFGVMDSSRFVLNAGDMEAVAVCIYLPVTGDAPGHVAYILPYPDACRLVDFVMMQPAGATCELGEMEYSALMETGNILASSYLTALAEMSGLRLYSNPPGVATDMAAAIISTVASSFSQDHDSLISIETTIDAVNDVPGSENGSIEGIFIYVPDPGSLNAILQALETEI